MAILFIDLTDGNGVGRNAVTSLRVRYGEGQVIHLNLLQEARSFTSYQSPLGEDLLNPAEIAQLANAQGNLETIDQIMVAAHGDMFSIDRCYHDEFGQEGALMSAEALARFTHRVLNALQLGLASLPPITLLVCYGARALDYNREHAQDSGLDFMQTFAGRFSAQFQLEQAPVTPITLYAYTGAIEFKEGYMVDDTKHPSAGHIFCEPEERATRQDEREDALKRVELFATFTGSLSEGLSSVLCGPCDDAYQRHHDVALSIDRIDFRKDYGQVLYTIGQQGVELDVGGLQPHARQQQPRNQCGLS